jgi:hypothetical protein
MFSIVSTAFFTFASHVQAAPQIYENHMEGILRIESTPGCGLLELGSEDVVFKGCQYVASIFRPELWPLRITVLVADRHQTQLNDGDLLRARLNRVSGAKLKNIYIATLQSPVEKIKYTAPKITNFFCSTGVISPYTTISIINMAARVTYVSSSPMDPEPPVVNTYDLDLETTGRFTLYTAKEGELQFQLKVPSNRPVPLFDATHDLDGFGFDAVYRGRYISCR